jgi:hypothetical protein
MDNDLKRVPYLVAVGGKNLERPKELNVTLGYIRQIRDNEIVTEESLHKLATDALAGTPSYVEAYIYKLEKVLVRSVHMNNYRFESPFASPPVEEESAHPKNNKGVEI